MRGLAKIMGSRLGTPRLAVRGALGPAVLLLFVMLLAGCPKKPEVGQAGPGAVGPQGAVTAPTPLKPTSKAPETPVSRPAAPREAAVAPTQKPSTAVESPLTDVFFDFDKADIRDDQKAAMAGDVAWLKANPAAKVLVGGHCDERGTAEYNLGLGDRRAKAVRDFLVSAGIEPPRIRTVSYGKERPFVLGHDESAWKFNRRAHLVRE